jgi:hypothetical protein
VPELVQYYLKVKNNITAKEDAKNYQERIVILKNVKQVVKY